MILLTFFFFFFSSIKFDRERFSLQVEREWFAIPSPISHWWRFFNYPPLSTKFRESPRMLQVSGRGSTLTDPLYHLSVCIQAGKWGRKVLCPVIGHSVITVSKSLLLYETSSIPVGLHIAAETTSVPCLLVSKKKGGERWTKRET